MSDLQVFIDGEPQLVPAGSTVASALLAVGRVSWRQTPSGQPRGMFCGIGVCFDCLVRVNGQADLRACLIEVQAGDQIETAAPNAD